MAAKTSDKVTLWMADHGVALLRTSLGIIFLWFGVMKYFPGLSSMEDLSVRTMKVLTFNLFSDRVMSIALATLESFIGIGLLSGKFLKITLALLLIQLAGAFSPIILFPHEVFNIIPVGPNLAGQYIIKDLVIISAGILIGGTVRGGKIVSDPAVAAKAKNVEEKKLNENDR